MWPGILYLARFEDSRGGLRKIKVKGAIGIKRTWTEREIGKRRTG